MTRLLSISFSLFLILALAFETSGQTVKVWYSNGTDTILHNGEHIPGGATVLLQVAGLGKPAGNDPRRKWILSWDAGNCQKPIFTSHRFVSTILPEGRYKPRVVLEAIYSDEDFKILEYNDEFQVGNGFTPELPPIRKDWFDGEMLNSLRPGRFVAYEIRYRLSPQFDNELELQYDLTFDYPIDQLEFIPTATPVQDGIGCDYISINNSVIDDQIGQLQIDLDSIWTFSKHRFFLVFKVKSGLQEGDEITNICKMSLPDRVDPDELGVDPEDLPSVIINGTVTTSDDPNMKEVIPSSYCAPEPLVYTIHFENEGSAPAQRIWIIDSLHENLNSEVSNWEISPFEHLPATNPFVVAQNRMHNADIGPLFTPPMTNPGLDIYIDPSRKKIAWVFNGLDLPGVNDLGDNKANTNKGWVRYTATVDNTITLANGTAFGTHAEIWFDENMPVATDAISGFAAKTFVSYSCDKDPISGFPIWILLLLLILLIIMAIYFGSKVFHTTT